MRLRITFYGAAPLATGQNAAASMEFQQALRLKPDFPNARFNLAHAMVNSGKRAAAISVLQQILKDLSKDTAAKEYLDELLLMNRQ